MTRIPARVVRLPAQEESTLRVFLIADVRGYTQFTHEQGDEAGARLAIALAGVARETVVAHSGEVIELRGDEALAVFRSARQALRAAVDLQERLAQLEAADPSLPLRAGVGLDAGDAVAFEGGYRGGALNLAARLSAIARAGEVFASATVISLARHVLGLMSVDRGRVQLKGFPDPVQVFQIGRDGKLPDDLPRFTAYLDSTSNLPVQATPFIGRERELGTVSALLLRDDIRLLTLTGPGGTGKTRLALQAAGEVRAAFRDGVCSLSLASLSEAQMVPAAIAAVLRIQLAGGDPLAATIAQLRDRNLLLVLDNFEHLMDAALVIFELLAACRGLKIMVTSRAVLHLSGENLYAVPSLSLPDAQGTFDSDQLLAFDAVALFVARATAARPDFPLTTGNSRAVGEICRRLDGLPLAIELAAARVRYLSPPALLARLETRLRVLVGGARDVPARQQTLRAAIDWSFDLLTPEERALFTRLAVFNGGFSLDAVRPVCFDDHDAPLDELELIESLVDKSLLLGAESADAIPRFALLETVREYALERLAGSGELPAVQRRQADFFLELAKQAERELFGPDQTAWLERLESEHDNLRAALAWALERGETGIGLELATSLWRFWQTRGYLAEAYWWMRRMLAADRAGRASGVERDTVRARALVLAGAFRTNQGDFDQGASLTEQSLELYRRLEDASGIASALNVLGNIAQYRCDYGHAEALFAESLELRRTLGDQRDIAVSLDNLAVATGEQNRTDEAIALYRESLAIQRRLGDRPGIAHVLNNLAQTFTGQGAYDEAMALLEESLSLYRELGDGAGTADALTTLGVVARVTGDGSRAIALHTEALGLYRTAGDQWGYLECLETLGGSAGGLGLLELSAQLLGAAAGRRATLGTPVTTSARARYDADVEAARAYLGAAAFAAAWERGRRLSTEEIDPLVASLTVLGSGTVSLSQKVQE